MHTLNVGSNDGEHEEDNTPSNLTDDVGIWLYFINKENINLF